MPLVSDVEGLKRPKIEISVSGGPFELDFLPGVDTVIYHDGTPYTVTVVTVVLGSPSTATVTVTP